MERRRERIVEKDPFRPKKKKTTVNSPEIVMSHLRVKNEKRGNPIAAKKQGEMPRTSSVGDAEGGPENTFRLGARRSQGTC